MRDYGSYNSCDNCQASGCTFAVPGVLGALLAAVIGLLVGASMAGTIIENMVAFVILAVVLFVGLGIWAIIRFCRCRCQRD